VAAEWAAWAVWISKSNRSGTTIRKARQQWRAFDVWMRSTTYNDSKTKRINLGSNSKGEVVIFPLLDGMRMDGSLAQGALPYLYEHWQPLPTPPANDHIKTAAAA
jgi:hypothetical protein